MNFQLQYRKAHLQLVDMDQSVIWKYLNNSADVLKISTASALEYAVPQKT